MPRPAALLALCAGLWGACMCNSSLASAPLAAAPAGTEYHALCDAGSTGTRLYIFSIKAGSAAAQQVFVKKIKPGVSSYAGSPAGVVPPLLALLLEGAAAVPEAERARIPTTILGTAGMRLLPSEQQDAIWSALGAGLSAAREFPFARGQLEMRTVSGDDEGLWAVLAANYLTGRVSHDLRTRGPRAPVGLLDLGGSSTQVAIPPAAAAGAGGVHVGRGATVHSYIGFGMTRIREKLRANATDRADAVCYMKGYTLHEGGEALEGAGDAPACRELVEAMMSEESHACRARRDASLAVGDSKAPCLGDLAHQAAEARAISEGKLDFFAVSGFCYAVDFVRWWGALQGQDAAAVGGASALLAAFPRPSLAELHAAVDALCASHWDTVAAPMGDEATRHPYSGLDNSPFRCFQANYIAVLLGKVYGFHTDARAITYALQIEGEDLEWPLGALLHRRQKQHDQEKNGHEL